VVSAQRSVQWYQFPGVWHLRKPFLIFEPMKAVHKIKSQLKRMKPQLAAKYGVNEIGLFGSITRDDFSTDSDIDIVVDFNRSIGIEFIDLANELEALLHRKVDLVSKKGIKPKYFKEIQKDLIYV